jgi:hypothetical protein
MFNKKTLTLLVLFLEVLPIFLAQAEEVGFSDKGILKEKWRYLLQPRYPPFPKAFMGTIEKSAHKANGKGRH